MIDLPSTYKVGNCTFWGTMATEQAFNITTLML